MRNRPKELSGARESGLVGSSQRSRPCRLLRSVDFDAVYREGRRKSGKQFAVFFRPNGGQVARFGISAKKLLGSAVKRNRIRRRIREILRLHYEEIAPGWDIVIHPRSAVATEKFGLLAAELIALIGTATEASPSKPA